MTKMLHLTDGFRVPLGTRAVLWDMDGVLIDSITFDAHNCSRILRHVTGIRHEFSYETIRGGFALSPDDFWKYLLAKAETPVASESFVTLIEDYEEERRTQEFPLYPGIPEALSAIRAAGMKMAVVSNNATADVERILANAHLDGLFDLVLGNDGERVRKKPFPDMYLKAAELLDVPIADCVVVEDSLIGAEAGRSAGAFTIGVATGGASLAELEASGYCDACHESFAV